MARLATSVARARAHLLALPQSELRALHPRPIRLGSHPAASQHLMHPKTRRDRNPRKGCPQHFFRQFNAIMPFAINPIWTIWQVDGLGTEEDAIWTDRLTRRLGWAYEGGTQGRLSGQRWLPSCAWLGPLRPARQLPTPTMLSDAWSSPSRLEPSTTTKLIRFAMMRRATGFSTIPIPQERHRLA